MTLREQQGGVILKNRKIETTDDSVVADLVWKDFPCLYDKFLDGKIEPTDKYTLDIEKMGKQLREEIVDDGEFIRFFRCVTKWGARTGSLVRTRVENNNSGKEIAEAIRESAKYLQDYNRGDKQNYDEIKNAMKRIRKINGLGRTCGHISYASKILRMLSPQHVGVYDLVLQKNFLYKADAVGYVNFCGGCETVVGELKRRKIKKYIKKRDGETWRVKWGVADVEAVLFFVCKNADISDVGNQFRKVDKAT